MEQEAYSYDCSSSTTWVWKPVKMRRPPEAAKQQPRRRRGFLRLPPMKRDRGVRLTITYKGGAQCWYLVEARGEHQIFPGIAALEDVMARVYSER